MVQPLQKTVWGCLEKLNMYFSCYPAILLLGKYPEKHILQRDKYTTTFIVVLFKRAKTWKQPKYPWKDALI